MNLRKKTIKGLAWSGISQVGRQIIQLVITAILARLLSPNDFGLLGMALVFVNFAYIFNEMGMTGALIQKQDAQEKHYSSVFWLNILSGIVLMLITIISSPFIAKFYNKPELENILKVISLNFVIASFSMVQKTLFTKEMEFKKLAIIELVAVITGGVVGIILAYLGYKVWSLVYQLLTFTFVNMLLLWLVSKWKPKLIFSLSAIKDIFKFSINLTGFNVLNYFARNIDKLLIGKFLGSQALGFYSLAYRLMIYPLRNISWVVSKVMFPAFSKIQNDLQKVRQVYMKMVKAISLITFPMMLGLFAVAPEFVNVVFGPKWQPLVVLIRILCYCGMLQSVGTTVGTILLSQGRADLQFKMQILGTILVTLSIMIGLKWGINGVALFYTLQSIGWVHFTFYVVNRIIKLPYKEFYSKMINSYKISIFTTVIVLLMRLFINFSAPFKLISAICLGIGIYIFLLLVTKEIKFDNKKVILVAIR